MKVAELHWSDLKVIEQSPAHFRWRLENKPPVQTPSMRYGSLLHCLVLGGKFVSYPGERRGNAWKDFEAANEGAFIVTQKELGRCLEASRQVLSDPVAGPYLRGDKEREWKAQMFGRACGGRIDVSGKTFTVDLKFTRTTDPAKLQRQALQMGWHAQIAWYMEARRALGEDPGEGVLVAIESKEPHPVTVMRLTERCLLEGAKQNRLWLERLQACEEADHWPGYVQAPIPLDVVEDANILVFGDTDEEAA